MPNFTELAIKNSFIKLLNERPLSKITVKDIVEDCGINRNSFYYHYEDLPTLIEELVTEEADKIITAYPDIDSIETCLLAAIHFARQNKKAIMHIYNSVNRALFEQYLWKVCDYVVSSYSAKLFAGLNINETDKNIIVKFYKYQCFGVVIGWMESGMKDDVEQNIHRLCELKKGMIEEMVERSVKN